MTDKMDKGIRNNMLDDLLGDDDKSKKPEPKRQSNFDWGRGDDLPDSMGGRSYNRQGSLLDDDGPDPLDSNYGGTRRLTSSRRDSVFNNRTSHSYETRKTSVPDSWRERVRKAIATGGKVGKELIIGDEAKRRMVEGLVVEFGKILDDVDLVWSTKGRDYFKANLEDLVEEMYHFTWKIRVEDDFDPETGEIKDVDREEREAIQSEPTLSEWEKMNGKG